MLRLRMEFRLKVRLEMHIRVEYPELGVEVSIRYSSGEQLVQVWALELGLGGVS